jgi:hypothetical protein
MHQDRHPPRRAATARPRAALIGAALIAALTSPAAASAKAGGAALQRLAAAQLGAGPREVAVLASAAATSGPGGAAIVRLDRGSGAPTCHLLALAGAPPKPERVTAAARLSVCPAYEKGKQPKELKQVELFDRRLGWRVRLGSQRMDTLAGGVETRQLWALYGAGGDSLPALFERTSTTFRGAKDSAANVAEVCEAPAIDAGAQPPRLTIACQTMTMLGAAAKKARPTFTYRWTGARFERE